jgi:hypothetical protein
MLKVEKREIDGSEYTVTQLDAWRAMRLLARVGAVIGPALSVAADAAATGDVMGMSADKAGSVIASLAAKLTPEELEAITRELLWNALRDDRPISGKQFGLEMAGQMATVFKLLFFAFEVNYGDFFDAARGLLAKMPRAAAQFAPPASTTSPTSGPAGASG